MVNTISLGHRTALVEQEWKRNRMLAEILRRFPDAIAFFGRDIDEGDLQFVQLLFIRLKLSQALAAVRSPGASGEFDHQCSVRNHLGEQKRPFTIGGG